MLSSKQIEIFYQVYKNNSVTAAAKILKENDIKVKSVSSLTKFPEIFGGRVKSIHPNIAGGILGQRDKDAQEAKKNKVQWIDMVICNLYPFQKIAQNPNSSLEKKTENIFLEGSAQLGTPRGVFLVIILYHNSQNPLL